MALLKHQTLISAWGEGHDQSPMGQRRWAPAAELTLLGDAHPTAALSPPAIQGG